MPSVHSIGTESTAATPTTLPSDASGPLPMPFLPPAVQAVISVTPENNKFFHSANFRRYAIRVGLL